MNTQYRKNLKGAMTACKNYTDKKIDALKWELGANDLSVQSDDSVAMVKTLPSGTIATKLNYIGGASKVSENLIVLNDVAETTTTQGITYKIENGVIYLSSGTASANTNILIKSFTLPAGTYYFKSFGATGGTNVYFTYFQKIVSGSGQAVAWSYDNKSITFTETTDVEYRFVVRSGESVSNLQFKDMLVSGSTAPSEFSEGYDGIRSAKVTSVVVSGKNLFDKDTYTYTNGKSINDNGEAIANSSSWKTIEYYMPIQENTTYTLSGTAIGTANWGTRIAFYDENYNQISQIKSSNIVNNYTFTTPSGTRYWRYCWAIVTDTSDWMLNLGSTALDYVPYIAPITKAIPQEVLALDLCKSAGTVYDVIDLVNKNGVTNVVSYTFTGEETISLLGGYTNIFYFELPTTASATTSNCLTSANDLTLYTTFNDMLYNNTSNSYICGSTNGTRLLFKLINITDTTSALAYLTGKTFNYELATPVETDISSYLPTDFEKVATNDQYGSVEFVNDYDYDMPNSITNLIEEVKA